MMMMGRGRICLTFSSINQIIFCSFLIPLKIVDAFSFRNPFTLGEQLFFDENFKVSLLNTPYSSITKTIYPQHQKAYINSNCLMARYGPKEDSDSISSSSNDDSSVLLEQQTEKLRQLVREIIEAKPPESLPSIVTKYLDVLLSIKVDDGVKAIKNIVEEAASSSDEQKEEVEVACEYILNFMEAFVEEARSMDDKNKNLLGRIVRAIAPSTTDGSYSARCREEKLDSVLEEEKENFTPSFLRHVENECRRLANSPAITKDSARLLETLQIIHLRIMEELGKNLGEGALVLGQLIGYDDKAERIAVLEGALTVRGVNFAKELSSLTKEALDGFKEASAASGGGVRIDKELVDRVKEIDDRLNGFLDWNN